MRTVFISKFAKKFLNVEFVIPFRMMRQVILNFTRILTICIAIFKKQSYPSYITTFATNYGDSPRDKIGGTVKHLKEELSIENTNIWFIYIWLKCWGCRRNDLCLIYLSTYSRYSRLNVWKMSWFYNKSFYTKQN